MWNKYLVCFYLLRCACFYEPKYFNGKDLCFCALFAFAVQFYSLCRAHITLKFDFSCNLMVVLKFAHFVVILPFPEADPAPTVGRQ